MQRETVQSSNLHSVGYDSASKTLEIEFKNGDVYQYHDVLAPVYQGLMNAASHGEYFNDHIRNIYKYAKV